MTSQNSELNEKHNQEFAKSKCMERMTRMLPFVFTVIVALLCASPNGSQGKYTVLSNSDLDYL